MPQPGWRGPTTRPIGPAGFTPSPGCIATSSAHLSRVEEVHLLVQDRAAETACAQHARKNGAQLDRVHFHQWPTNRIWMRDSGPIFITRSGAQDHPVAITNWRFNAWAKYEDWQLDDQLPLKASELLHLRHWTPEFSGQRVVLEGGSIDVNGQGTLITTEECLLSPVQQRNPGLSREDLERVFQDYLGIDQVLWMDRGIAGDDTHGHVDDITRFVNPLTIVTVTEPNKADDNHLPLAENLDRLHAARDPQDRPYTIVELPMPSPVVFQGQRLPASYANFYIANGLVLVPTFNDANDRKALNILAGVFPDREVVGIHSGDLIWGLGTLHCMTQQQPAGT